MPSNEKMVAEFVYQTRNKSRILVNLQLGMIISLGFLALLTILSIELRDTPIDSTLIYVGLGIISGLFIFCIFKTFTITKNLAKDSHIVEKNILQRNLLSASFSITPTGNSNGEKIFNFIKIAIPGLQQSYDYQGPISDQNQNQYDLLQMGPKTSGINKLWTFENIVIAKHFGDELITSDKLLEFCNNIPQSLKDKNIKKRLDSNFTEKIFRILIVGTNYDEELLHDENYLEETMNKISFNQIDLLKDEKTRFDIIWMS
jgi:hypothetical protein